MRKEFDFSKTGHYTNMTLVLYSVPFNYLASSASKHSMCTFIFSGCACLGSFTLTLPGQNLPNSGSPTKGIQMHDLTWICIYDRFTTNIL